MKPSQVIVVVAPSEFIVGRSPKRLCAARAVARLPNRPALSRASTEGLNAKHAFELPPQAERTTPTMNQADTSQFFCTPRWPALCLIMATQLPSIGFAQAKAADPKPTPGSTTEEVLELSPFTVSSERDRGFVAGSGVSGSRLATELKDTAVAYSVVNQEMIQALGITDLNSAAEWTTNTQKFVDPAGGGDFFNITAPIQVRGVGNISQFRQRNFFYYFAPMDSSSVERYDFGRGPNSVLFGNGTIGGTQMSMTKRARFDKPFEELQLNYGSWDYARVTLDVNQPITSKVSARLAAAYADRDGWRDFDMEKTRNLFGTVTIKPTPKTEIRVDGETGQQDRTIGPTVMRDFLAGWDGKTTFAGPMTDAIRNGTADPATGPRLTNTGENQGVDRRGSNYFVWDPNSGQNAIMNYTNDPMTRSAAATQRVPIGGYTYGAGPSFNANNSQLIYALDVPAGMYDNAINHSFFRIPGKRFNNLVKGPLIQQHYRDLQVTASHQFGDSIFVELAADVNRVNNKINQFDGRGLVDTYIDINRKLPNGADNPHFLQPYGDGSFTNASNIRNGDSVRAAFAYIKDFGKWGNYAFNLLGGVVDQEQKALPLLLSIKQNADPRQWGNLDVLRERVYWYEAANRDYNPPTQPINYIDPLTGVQKTIMPEWVYTNNGDNTNIVWSKNKYQYGLAALTAKYFKQRLILMGAVRYDKYDATVKFPVNQGDYPADWTGHSIIWRPDAPSDWLNLAYWRKTSTGANSGNAPLAADTRPRINNAQGVPLRDPLYANDRFRNDYNPPPISDSKPTFNLGTVVHLTPWASVFADRAESFTLPATATPTITGNFLPPVEAKGWDAGVRFFLLNSRVNFSATKYHNVEYGSYEQPTATNANINGIWQANAVGDNSTDGRNIRGFSDIVSGSQDIRNRVAEGLEFEVVANITKNWRTTFNVGLPKVYVTERFPITRAYIKTHEQDFIQVLQDAGGALDTTQHPNGAPGLAYAPTLPAGTIARDQASVVTNYNNLYANAANIVTGKQLANDQKNLNAFTDYRFPSGWAKGIRVGFGAQYRGQLVVGYRGADTIVDPNDPTKAIDDPAVDAYTPVKVPGRITYTATIGYSYKLKNRREISFNLAIRNLFNQQSIIYVDPTVLRPKNGDYTSPARESVAQRASYQEPISYYFTATLRM